MSPPEDGSTNRSPGANVATPAIVRLTGHVRSGMTLGKIPGRKPTGLMTGGQT
jgi:hypothetical protein